MMGHLEQSIYMYCRQDGDAKVEQVYMHNAAGVEATTLCLIHIHQTINIVSCLRSYTYNNYRYRNEGNLQCIFRR